MAATEGFSAATINAAAAAGGAFISGATSGLVLSGGDLRTAARVGVIGAAFGALGGASGLGSPSSSFGTSEESSFASVAKFSAKRVADYYLRRETDNFFQKEFGVSGLALDLSLTVASFIGNEIYGSRYKGAQVSNVEYISGIFSRPGRRFGEDALPGYSSWPAELVDIVLMTRGLPTASGWDYVANGDKALPLVGFSLGAGDVNTLASWGLGSKVGNSAISLPVGQIGAPNTQVTLGAWDVVNGGFWGLLTSPSASLENSGTLEHSRNRYCALERVGLGSCPN